MLSTHLCEMAPAMPDRVGLGDHELPRSLPGYLQASQKPRSQTSRDNAGFRSDLFTIPDRSVTAVVVDPPYADNVQYSELADFFYVCSSATVGDIYPEWYMTPLSPNTMEMVVNEARVRVAPSALSGVKAKDSAYAEYEKQMTASSGRFAGSSRMTESFRDVHLIRSRRPGSRSLRAS